MSRSPLVAVRLQEARELERRGRLEEALAVYAEALAAHPDYADGWYGLARLQRKAGRFDAALDSYQQALDRDAARPEEIHLNRGVIYSDDLRRPDAARAELQAALALNPEYLAALLNLANLQEDLGERTQAAELYERALRIDPNCALALARRVGLQPCASAADPWIERLRRALADLTRPAVERADLGFALGRALDACGEYAAAFAAYAGANLASGASLPPDAPRYDRGEYERFVDRLIAVFNAVEPVTAPAVPATGPRPVFICGMFRSGSTLIEQILAGHGRITAGGELDLLPRMVRGALAPFPEALPQLRPAQLAVLAERYRQGLAMLFPQADLVTDKRLENFLFVGLIKRLFPDARIVHTTRDALDNCLSIFFLHLDPRLGYALNLGDIGHYYRHYRRLMRHWMALFGADIHEVNYDALVRDPESVARPLFDFLQLDWQPACLQLPRAGVVVKTASVWQVREPLHGRSSGRARHYADELTALRNELADP